MEKLKKEWPHMAVLGASFLLLPALAVLTGEGAVMVVLLLLVFPLESLLCSFFAGKAGGFAWWFFLATGVLFTATVPLYYNGTANIYGGVYALMALAANAFGAYIASDKARRIRTGSAGRRRKRRPGRRKSCAERRPQKLGTCDIMP